MQGAAAFFDLDKTIIAKSSTLAFGRPFFHGGLIGRRAVLRASYAQLVYLVAGAHEEQMDRMRDYLAALSAGWELQQVREIVKEALHDVVDPLIYDEAASLIEQHKAEGRQVVIVSTSGEEVVGPIGEVLGADRVVATRMVVADGRYTGDIAFYAYGASKAAAVRELAEAEGYNLAECYAYSDSATDVPLLEAVGRPVAVNPDRTLRRLALQRGWPVLRFTRPVSMRSRLAGGLRTPSRRSSRARRSELARPPASCGMRLGAAPGSADPAPDTCHPAGRLAAWAPGREWPCPGANTARERRQPGGERGRATSPAP